MTNVFQFGCGYRAFTSYWWRHWLSPRTYWKPFHRAYQRVTRGWADCDTWGVDTWLCGVLPAAIEHLRDNAHGYPNELTEEQWAKILTEIADGFRAGAKVSDVPDEFVSELETSTGWRERLDLKDNDYDWEKINAYQAEQTKKFEHGMDLFKQYFFNLWD